MIRLPYNWRRLEGVNSGIPKLRVLHYKLDCVLENLFIRFVKLPNMGINTDEKRSEKVVVSLTSFPARIDKVYYAIKSLMLQSYKADRIVLWLAASQFPNEKVPPKIKDLTQKGLTIRFCDDLRSHKKYFYQLQEQKENEVVITYDDDIIYEYDSIEKLIVEHKKFPQSIICNRAQEMVFDEVKHLMPYKRWKVCSPIGVKKPEMNLMPSTGNGCLYPFNCMPKVTFDWEIIKDNALTADDIWMRFCSYSNGITVVKTREKIATLCNVFGSQKEKLTAFNDIGGENERVIKRLEKVFSNMFGD